MTRAGSLGCEFGVRTTEPEQLLNATMPVKSTVAIVGAGAAVAAASMLGAAPSVSAVMAPTVSSERVRRRRGLVVTAGCPFVDRTWPPRACSPACPHRHRQTSEIGSTALIPAASGREGVYVGEFGRQGPQPDGLLDGDRVVAHADPDVDVGRHRRGLGDVDVLE